MTGWNSSDRNGLAALHKLAHRPIEGLEPRFLLAAHVVGSSTVYSTIQAAVNAAPTGGTVRVDPGTYPEIVTVGRSMTVDGAQAGVDARSNSRMATGNESVITGKVLSDGTISGAFYVTANNVTIDGFTCQGSTSNGTYGAGIVLGPRINGSIILDNILQNNVSGLFLSNNSSTNPALIQHNAFLANNHNGANGGRGIYTDGSLTGGNLTNVTIDSNVFKGNHGGSGTTGLEAAVSLESRTANSQSNIRITNNLMDTNGKAVLVYNATAILIQGNVISATEDWGSGALRFEGGATNVTIKNNTAFDNKCTAIRMDSKAYAANNSGFVINNNNFYGNSWSFTNKESLAVAAGTYSGTVDARNNWWGNASGPGGAGPGTGDTITSNGNTILFSPWSTTAYQPLDTSFYGTPASVDARIDATYYDEGGEGNAYHDVDPNGGPFRIEEGVDTENTADNGGFDVGWTAPGEWMNFIVTVPQTGTYTANVRVATAQTTGGTFHFALDGQNVTGPITLPYTGGNQGWRTITQPGVNLTAGQHVLKLAFDTAGTGGQYVGSFHWFSFTSTGVSPLPASPSNLNALAAGPTAVNLTWTDNSNNETGFIIERQTGSSGTWQPLTTTAAGAVAYTDTTAGAGTTYTYRVRATNSAGDSANSNLATVTTPALQSTAYLSDLPFATPPTNGWGPVERDMSNGGSGAGDGHTLTLNGVTYAKGLGVHAISDVAFNLGAAYGTFVSDVGIDDEVSSGGSVIFQVFADGVKIFDSGVMTATSATQTVTLSVTGVQQLRLHVDDAGDGIDYDHADWAGARLLTSVATPTPPAAPTALTATALSPTQVKLSWTDNATNETGYKIERSTDGTTFSQIATVGTNVTTFTDTTAAGGTAYWYRIRATTGTMDSAYSNVASTNTPAASATTYLSDLNWVSATAGWGTIHKDQTIVGNTITLRGVTYAKGIGTHALSQIVYALNGQYASFVSDVGVDDEENGRGIGSVDFQVIGDGRVLFDSGVVTNSSPTVSINISVAGVQQLTLVATNGVAGSIDYDHADWAGARLLSSPASVPALRTSLPASKSGRK